jgi:RecA-family ATPase
MITTEKKESLPLRIQDIKPSVKSVSVRITMQNKEDLSRVLEVIDQLPQSYIDDYGIWTTVGMVLKDLGGNVGQWELWSRSSSKYSQGECQKKWHSFKGGGRKTAGVGSIMEYAKECGIDIPKSSGLSLAGLIKPDKILFDWNWLNDAIIEQPPLGTDLSQDIQAYANIMFSPTDIVCFNQKAENRDGKWVPMGIGNWCEARNLGEAINKHNSDHGVWVRINPFDGKGVSDKNVVDHRYALVESDTLSIEKQVAVYQELDLPIKILVHSGGKSAHAIVKIDADNYDEYQARVDYLYDVLDANGMDVDRQNRNPARLSRLPGVMRGENPQYIMGIEMGKKTWDQWHHYIELRNDNMPPLEKFDDMAIDPPEKAEAIIENVVRRGHKMSISSASKAGKSFLLTNLSHCLANGTEWLGMNCRKSKVLYCNLEISRESFNNRLIDVAEANGHPLNNSGNLVVWNLRGKPCGLRSFAPKLLRKMKDGGFEVLILDPYYKTMEGDENSAKDVTELVNLFDVITEQSGVTLITVGHYSKGKQGAKAAQDRQSGSGVLARDPDAIIALTPLEDYPKVFRMEFDLREFPPHKPIDLETKVTGEEGRTVMTHVLTTHYKSIPLAGSLGMMKKNDQLCAILLDKIINVLWQGKQGIVYMDDVCRYSGLPGDKVEYVLLSCGSRHKIDGRRIVK